MSKRNRPVFDAASSFQRIMATTPGWLLGRLIFANLPLVSAGVGVGVLQWPILYRRIPKAWRWPLAAAVGWIAGSIVLLTAVTAGLEGYLAGLIVGPCVGLAQWLLLRRVVLWSGWWIAVSTLAWITGLSVLPGALAGALTGVAVVLLFRYEGTAWLESTEDAK